MLFEKTRKSTLVLLAALMLGGAVWAQTMDVATTVVPATHTLTINIKGTIGPILSGSDPLGFDGKSGTVTVLASVPDGVASWKLIVLPGAKPLASVGFSPVL